MTQRSGSNITVIIPTFNRSALVLKALDSVLSQSVQADRVLVVDDGSTDDTRAVLVPYLDRIEYVFQENGGKPAALNNGLARIDSGWVWVFDDDDIALPRALELHLAALNREPDAHFSYSAFWFAKSRDDDGLDKTVFEPVFGGAPHELFGGLLDDCVISVQGMLVDVACYKAVGGYDEGLDRAEDYDFFLRLTQRFEGVAVEEPTYLRRVHEGIRGSGAERHGASAIQDFFLKFEGKIFDRLYTDLPLAFYAENRRDETFDDTKIDARVRRALIKRSGAMFRKGQWENGLRDLKSLEAFSGLQPLSRDECKLCNKAFAAELIPYALSQSPETLQALREHLSSDVMREIRVELARGIVSRLSRDIRATNVTPIAVWFRIAKCFGFLPFVKLLTRRSGK